jgi:hypothetical protein
MSLLQKEVRAQHIMGIKEYNFDVWNRQSCCRFSTGITGTGTSQRELPVHHLTNAGILKKLLFT